MLPHIFVAGIPATGKSWLGNWLEDRQGYVHIDAERDGGARFDRINSRAGWEHLVQVGHADLFMAAVARSQRPVVLNWGFPTQRLYVVSALKAAGIRPFWLGADREHARAAFIDRGGIDVQFFDRQMDDIDREWLRIQEVFGARVIQGLDSRGRQRLPGQLWAAIRRVLLDDLR